MNIRINIGYKFILGFIAVVAAAAFVPGVIGLFDLPEYLSDPVSFLIAILIGLILGSVFTKSFTRHFALIISLARRISMGDLRKSEEIGGMNGKLFQDETTDLEEALNAMAENLRAIVEQVRAAVDNLAKTQQIFSDVVSKGNETSKEVITGTSHIFDGAVTQANHVEDASTTVKEMAELADDVARKVTESSHASQKVNTMVHRGAVTATSAMEKMETIFKGIENTGSAAARLKEKLNDIPKILDVITHISRQTDLLALNATIEASKAGEHGRGFAMVAEEVRRFADNTNKSVEDVSLIVKELKGEVERVVDSAGESTSNLKGGRDDLRKIREILVDITHYTTEVAEGSSVILSLTQGQKEKAIKTVSTIELVAGIARGNLTSTEMVDTAVERHGAAMKETMTASERLAELSNELKNAVSKFNLN